MRWSERVGGELLRVLRPLRADGRHPRAVLVLRVVLLVLLERGLRLVGEPPGEAVVLLAVGGQLHFLDLRVAEVLERELVVRLVHHEEVVPAGEDHRLVVGRHLGPAWLLGVGLMVRQERQFGRWRGRTRSRGSWWSWAARRRVAGRAGLFLVLLEVYFLRLVGLSLLECLLVGLLLVYLLLFCLLDVLRLLLVCLLNGAFLLLATSSCFFSPTISASFGTSSSKRMAVSFFTHFIVAGVMGRCCDSYGMRVMFGEHRGHLRVVPQGRLRALQRVHQHELPALRRFEGVPEAVARLRPRGARRSCRRPACRPWWPSSATRGRSWASAAGGRRR